MSLQGMSSYAGGASDDNEVCERGACALVCVLDVGSVGSKRNPAGDKRTIPTSSALDDPCGTVPDDLSVQDEMFSSEAAA